MTVKAWYAGIITDNCDAFLFLKCVTHATHHITIKCKRAVVYVN